MVKSRLPNSVLRRIWAMSDIDGDGLLDRDEFAVAMFLIDHKLNDNDLPETLPDRVIPPNKRRLAQQAQRSAPQSQLPAQSFGGRSRHREEIDDPMYNSARPSYGYASRSMHDYDDDDDDTGNGLAGFVEH